MKLVLLLALASPSPLPLSSPLLSPSPVVTSPLFVADELFEKRGVSGAGEEAALAALQSYKALVEASPKDGPLRCRLAMAYYFVGHRLTQIPSKKEDKFDEGAKHAREGVALQPNSAACLFWQAINEMLYANTRGAITFFSRKAQILELLERSQKIDPSFAGAGALRLQGQLFSKIPKWFGGDEKLAVQKFELAIQNAPAEPLNYLQLAQFFIERKRDAEARAVVERGVKASSGPLSQFESIEARDELQLIYINLQSQP